jgi:5,10-methylenetetrahydrofolate reductase
METLQLKLSLAGIDTPEDKLRELQSLLQDAGIFVKLEIEPPAEEEMGGKVTALILVFSLASEFGHLPPSVEEAFRQIEEWQQQQQVIRPVIHLSGKKKLDEEIQETIRREQLHIEVKKPKFGTPTGQPGNSIVL